MKYVKINPKMRRMGNSNSFWTTTDIVEMVSRFGKTFNSGTNPMKARVVTKAIDKAKESKSTFIELEDEHHALLVGDINAGFDWGAHMVAGVAFVEDIESILEASKEEPEKAEFKPEYPEDVKALEIKNENS